MGYFDVLKCEGQFATPSEIFGREIKAVHSSTQRFRWADQQPKDKDDTKHRLRQTFGNESMASSSSIFTPSSQHLTDGALPHSVFRLPNGTTTDGFLSGMTSGGRSLCRVNQTTLSQYDRKLNLI